MRPDQHCPSPLTADEFRFYLAADPDDPPPDCARIEQHLEACEWCSAHLEQLLDPVAEHLRSLLAESQLPGTGRDEVLGAAFAPPALASQGEPVEPRIPGYELVRKLGEGGMGVVYLARDVNLKREVALKTLHAGDAAGPPFVARFWAEAEVMAAVRHPHVVQVHELGVHDGQPFLAMEYVPGGSMADWLKGRGPVPPRDTAALVEKVARGVAAAHDQGIVHRDLKPGNVLFDEVGEPKVADFGLAKRPSHDLTRTQARMGTPAYMAPEQAAGKAKFVGPQADVWALGVILYECLAGAKPFEAETVEEVLGQITAGEPTALRARVRGVPRDLDTIVSKCLAKRPEHRYATAGELADDLGRVVRGEPILARSVGRAERLVRWARRKPTAFAAYGLSALAVLLALVVFVVAGLWREAEVARDRLDVEKKLTESARDDAVRLGGQLGLAKKEVERQQETLTRMHYGRTIQAAYQLWRDNRIAEARALLANTRPDLRGWEYDYVHRLCHADLATLSGHTHIVTSATFSPDGFKVVTASYDKTARVWDARTGGQLLELKGHTAKLRSASFSPDGLKVVTACDDGTARLWDAKTGMSYTELKGHTESVETASFSPDGLKVVTSSRDHTARVWDAKTGKQLLELKGHTEPVETASFSPDGLNVLTASYDRTARLWDAKTGKQLLELKGHTDKIRSVSFSPDGARVVTASDDHSARVWDAKTGKQLLELKGHANWVLAATFSPNGLKVVTASYDKTARVWDARTGGQLLELKGHTGGGSSATFSSDGAGLLTAGERTACVWDAATGRRLLELKGHTDAVMSASFSPDGGRVVTASSDDTARVWDAKTCEHPLELKGRIIGPMPFDRPGERLLTAVGEWGSTVHVWDAATGSRLAELKGHIGYIVSASFGPDGLKVVTASQNDHTPRVWNAKTGAQLLELKGHTRGIYSASFSPDGLKVLTASADGTARLWDATSGKQLRELKGHTRGIYSASFSPDGLKVVTENNDLIAQVWDAATGELLLELKDRGRDGLSAAFSPDSARLLTIRDNFVAHICDATTGEQLTELKGHTREIGSARFSPDGLKVVTASDDRTARLWDAKTGRQLLELKGHSWEVSSATFSPDAARVVTVSSDHTARVWDAESGAELLALPGIQFAFVSPDGTRLVTALSRQTFDPVIYDSRPVNRSFIKPPSAPLPQPARARP